MWGMANASGAQDAGSACSRERSHPCPVQPTCLDQRGALQRAAVPQADGAVPGGRGQQVQRECQGAHRAGVPLQHLPAAGDVKRQAAGLCITKRIRRAVPGADAVVAGAAHQQPSVCRQAADGGAVPAAAGGQRRQREARDWEGLENGGWQQQGRAEEQQDLTATKHLTAWRTPLPKSQARTVRSTPPVKSRPSSGTRQHALTAALCPGSVSCAGRPSQQRACSCRAA